jgi:outer membrane protein insertion porin family
LLALFSLGCASSVLAVRSRSRSPQASASAAGSAVIAEIHTGGSSLYTDAQIAAAAGIKPGDTVTREQIQAAADQLTGLGVFSLVNYQFTSIGNKITINFALKDAPQVVVAFDNFPWLTDDELTAAIRQGAPLFNGDAPTDGAELDQISAAIATLLKSRGLPGTVEHRLVAHPTRDGVMIMQFSLDGPDITVDSIDFGEPLARNSEQLRDRQQDLLHKTFSRYTLEIFENEQIRPIYLASGHMRVHFGEPVVQIAGASSPSSAKVSVALHIDPGPVYNLAVVDWKGITALPPETLINLLVLKPGELADGMRLEAAWQRVTAEYEHRGYLDVKLEPVPEFDDGNARVSYHVNVTEGPQYHMGDMVLTGLSLDAENHLRYVWKLPKGAVFDGGYYESVIEKLAMPSAEFFANLPVHYTELGHFLRTDADTHTADVLLDFK